MRRLGAILAIVAALSSACGGGNAPAISATATPAAAKSITIRIGTSLPQTGPDAKIGKFYQDAYELFVKQTNDAGGLSVGDAKAKLELIVHDSASVAQTSADNYDKMANTDKVDFFLGGYNTSVVIQEIKIANRYKIPYVNGGGASSQIYEGNVWGFGVLAPIEKLATTQLDFMKSQQDAGHLPLPTRIFVAYENSSHGKEFLQGLAEGARLAPERFKITDQTVFDLSLTDAAPILAKLGASNSDAFMVDARVQDYTTIHKAYTAAGLYHPYVTYGPRGSEKTARDTLGVSADYLIAATWFDQNQPGPTVAAWLKMWQQTGNTPEWYAAGAWEASRILSAAITKAGSTDKLAVREVLASTKFSDSIFPGGTIKFNTFGQANNDYAVTQNLPDGKLGIVWPEALRTTPATLPIPRRK